MIHILGLLLLFQKLFKNYILLQNFIISLQQGIFKLYFSTLSLLKIYLISLYTFMNMHVKFVHLYEYAY